MAGVGARAHIMRVEVGLFANELFVDREVRSDKIAVFFPLQSDVLSIPVRAGRFHSCQCRRSASVGIAAVIALLHDARKIVDGGRILRRLTRTHEFWNAGGVVSEKIPDRGFRNDDPGRILDEIVGTVDDAGQAVHEHAIAFGRTMS